MIEDYDTLDPAAVADLADAQQLLANLISDLDVLTARNAQLEDANKALADLVDTIDAPSPDLSGEAVPATDADLSIYRAELARAQDDFVHDTYLPMMRDLQARLIATNESLPWCLHWREHPLVVWYLEALRAEWPTEPDLAMSSYLFTAHDRLHGPSGPFSGCGPTYCSRRT